MSELFPLSISTEEKERLREKLLRSDEKVRFGDDPGLAGIVAALGIQQEVGTANDELARFVYDAETGKPVPRESLRAELISYRSTPGVRIWAEGARRLELRFYGIRALLHPRWSFHADGTLAQLVVFPEIVARWLATERIEAVVVKPWALNTVFGGFHPSQGFYQTNMWEMLNIDVIRYAGLVENRQVPFLGTHDLVAHIAGSRGEAWDELAPLGGRVRRHIENYFAGISTPNLGSLILPYIAGIVLDDLAQPPCYGALSRRHVLEEVLRATRRDRIAPQTARLQLRFPELYEKLVQLARFGETSRILRETTDLVNGLIDEIHRTSVASPEIDFSPRRIPAALG